MRQKLLSICKVIKRRTDHTRSDVRLITGEMADIAKTVVKETLNRVKKLVPENLGDEKLIQEIHHISQLLNKVIEQTEIVNQGKIPTNRIVSLDDPEARPISKGKRGKRVEFGSKLQIEEIDEGIISGYQVFKGNPSDKLLIQDAAKRYEKQFGKVPREIVTDRGYYSSENEKNLKSMGIKHISIPKPGNKTKARIEIENTPKFKTLQKYRAGVEGRISCLKRRFGLRKSMLRGLKGTSTWCGFGILTHNLRKASQIINSN